MLFLRITFYIIFISACYTPDYKPEDTIIPPLDEQISDSICDDIIDVSDSGSGSDTEGSYTIGDTITSENLLKEFGQTLGELCRPMDILVRTDSDEFLALLPETDENGMKDFSGKIASAFYSMLMVTEAAKERPSLNMGWATFPADGIESHKDLLHAASREMIIAMREEESSRIRATG